MGLVSQCDRCALCARFWRDIEGAMWFVGGVVSTARTRWFRERLRARRGARRRCVRGRLCAGRIASSADGRAFTVGCVWRTTLLAGYGRGWAAAAPAGSD